jgi:hypothetical protein
MLTIFGFCHRDQLFRAYSNNLKDFAMTICNSPQQTNLNQSIKNYCIIPIRDIETSPVSVPFKADGGCTVSPVFGHRI